MPADLYLPDDPDYTLVDSVRDSIRFAHFCLEPCSHGRWRPVSSAVGPDGKPFESHPLAYLEGPSSEGNAIGAARILYQWARFDQNPILEKVALGLLDHVLEGGFIPESGPVRLYRDGRTGEFVPQEGEDPTGAQAAIGLQLLQMADALPAEDSRCATLAQTAVHMASFESELGPESPTGLLRFVLLLMELSERGQAERSEETRSHLRSAEAMVRITAGEHALASRVFRRAARHFRDPAFDERAIRALSDMLALVYGEDLSGQPTTGLYRHSPDSGQIWFAECAECALACLEWADATGDRDRACSGVTTLRAIARAHSRQAEPHGFLSAGLSLDSAGQNRDGAPLDQFTSPLYSNLAHVEPALHFLSRRVV